MKRNLTKINLTQLTGMHNDIRGDVSGIRYPR
jgi:hypothetical protein